MIRRIFTGAFCAVVAMAVLIAPIEIVYQLGGTYSQAMMAEAALMFCIAGGFCGFGYHKHRAALDATKDQKP